MHCGRKREQQIKLRLCVTQGTLSPHSLKWGSLKSGPLLATVAMDVLNLFYAVNVVSGPKKINNKKTTTQKQYSWFLIIVSVAYISIKTNKLPLISAQCDLEKSVSQSHNGNLHFNVATWHINRLS